MTHTRFGIVASKRSPSVGAARSRRLFTYHHNEDECSYVLSGTLGALLGDEVVKATPGTWVFKPRHQMAHLLERRRRAL